MIVESYGDGLSYDDFIWDKKSSGPDKGIAHIDYSPPSTDDHWCDSL
jgi:hypothetical protein